MSPARRSCAARGRTAVVVELRSRARTPLTDVPIAVGVRTRGGKALALNGGRDLDWFETHVAALAPGATTTWVFTARRRVPAGARAYARVGVPTSKPATPGGVAAAPAGQRLGWRARARAQRLRRPAGRPAGLRGGAGRRPLRGGRARLDPQAARRRRDHGRRAAHRRTHRARRPRSMSFPRSSSDEEPMTQIAPNPDVCHRLHLGGVRPVPVAAGATPALLRGLRLAPPARRRPRRALPHRGHPPRARRHAGRDRSRATARRRASARSRSP